MQGWSAPESLVLMRFVRSAPLHSLESEGGFDVERELLPRSKLKSLRLLSNLCAEETQMLASVFGLNSADRSMKTSALRQRKEPTRKQYPLYWAWQQGRKVVEILQYEKLTER
ncbi:hypothetical protein H920_16613 [Fukomys damarensis]|uniref:Uncharacterized protein n=1 Tax=Fukomys damarensis TaxID=885580 RepID=A0A091CU36_FUKDA|nr:hypothetical protein H920_16613 [Fukomys damarensis]